eukprot:3902554-Rhodomonas_salina.1
MKNALIQHSEIPGYESLSFPQVNNGTLDQSLVQWLFMLVPDLKGCDLRSGMGVTTEVGGQSCFCSHFTAVPAHRFPIPGPRGLNDAT